MAGSFGDFEHGPARDTGEASESVARKIWLLLELLRHRAVRFADYEALHERDKRSFQRDLQQLRAIGETGGFRISRLDASGTARLEHYDGAVRRLDDARPPLLRLLAELARTLGEPMRGELGALAASAPEGDVFLHVQAPTLVAGSHVAEVYDRLKAAWASPAGRACVRFGYRPSRGETSERSVEPYRVLVRSGRYYLIGYDRGRRAWRLFALDAIVGLPATAGTAPAQRTIPAEYANADVVGFIKGGGATTAVTVEFSAAVAASATSRVWQTGQRIEELADGVVRLTVAVVDLNEVVRWAFGFGADARVVTPPEAVAVARNLAERLVALHTNASAP